MYISANIRKNDLKKVDVDNDIIWARRGGGAVRRMIM